VFVLAVWALVPGAHAAVTTYVLSSGATDWSVAGNWTPSGPAAGAGNIAQYISTATVSATTALNVSGGGQVTIGQIQNSNSNGWTINTGSASGFTLNNAGGNANPTGGTDAFIGTTSTGTLGIVPAITIATTALDIGSASSGNLTLSGSISGAGNIFVKDNGWGATTLSGTINNTGTITNQGTSSGGLTISGSIGGSVTTLTQTTTTSGLTLSGNNAGTAANITLEEGTLTLTRRRSRA
jgi:hypothetical protein